MEYSPGKVNKYVSILTFLLIVIISTSCISSPNLQNYDLPENQSDLSSPEIETPKPNLQPTISKDSQTATVKALLTMAAGAQQTESAGEAGSSSTPSPEPANLGDQTTENIDAQTATVKALLTMAAGAQQTESAAQTKSASSPPTIPEINSEELAINLEDSGFICSQVEHGEAKGLSPHDIYYRRCEITNTEFYSLVEIYGDDIFSVYRFEVSILEYSGPQDTISINFLSQFATLPYPGAEPKAASAWVKEQIPTIKESGDVRFAEFGGVPFSLYGVPGNRSLIIGYLE